MLDTAVHIGSTPPAADHTVRFYEQDSFLAQEVARYIGTAVKLGQTALVIARPSLVKEVRQWLTTDGVAAGDGRLQVLNAQETLESFVRDGWPDERLFLKTVGHVVAQATAGGRKVCAFGEMVALLCEQGRYDAALRLEELWNGLRTRHNFSLFCAYPMRLFASAGDGPAFHHVCSAHHLVQPTENAGPASGPDHALTLARLQQKNLALEQAMGEREKLLNELTAANRAKDEFLAMLGHELRNPLAPIVTALELMKLRGDESTSRERAMIRRQLDHLLRLVDDLLDVSRITRGKVDLDKAVCRVSDVLAQAVEQATPLIEQRRHRLSVAVSEPDLHCNADCSRLAQMVANLLTNAARYTEPGGEIRVRAENDHGELHICVQDNGMGLAADMLQPIFELFRQSPQGIERQQGGLGIGLALVRSLAQLHGGRAWAESPGIGLGSCFHVCIPGASIAAAAVPVQPVAERTAAAPAIHARVLVVDDNREAADFLVELLGAYGCDARAAYDAAQALNVLPTFEPEVAILDIGLPVMDGYELATRFRGQMGKRACRLFALTGYGQQTDRQRSAAAGFEVHLVKPVDARQIAELITRR